MTMLYEPSLEDAQVSSKIGRSRQGDKSSTWGVPKSYQSVYHFDYAITVCSYISPVNGFDFCMQWNTQSHTSLLNLFISHWTDHQSIRDVRQLNELCRAKTHPFLCPFDVQWAYSGHLVRLQQ